MPRSKEMAQKLVPIRALVVPATAMPRFARSLWILSALVVVPAVVGSEAGCGTEPVSVDGCRRIEEARCDAAVSCPSLGVKDAAECKRFYRDQCLHGLAVADDPGGPVIEQCVEQIRLTGLCAASDPSCTALPATEPTAASACEIVQKPQLLVACKFLAPVAPAATVPTQPAGGAGGASAAGAAGAAGSPTAGAAGEGGTGAATAGAGGSS
jgi:hypothetical protein